MLVLPFEGFRIFWVWIEGLFIVGSVLISNFGASLHVDLLGDLYLTNLVLSFGPFTILSFVV